MGGVFSGLFAPRVDRNILLLGREGVGKTYLLYCLKGLTTKTVELMPTHAFNHFQMESKSHERRIEVWEPSGKSTHASLWSTYYQNVYFHVVIYVLDAAEYDPLDLRRKSAAIRQDKMELHTLLCEPSLKDSTLVVFLNWKADAQGQEASALLRNQVKATVSDDLEFHTSSFMDRAIIVVDDMEDLQPYVFDLKHRLGGAAASTASAASQGSKKKAEASQSRLP